MPEGTTLPANTENLPHSCFSIWALHLAPSFYAKCRMVHQYTVPAGQSTLMAATDMERIYDVWTI
ncbi:hypothetical protein MBHK15_100429 [Marinobacter salarius]|nr:hypothetical protein MBHK15_100429 [Marinobacter salarius]